MSFESDWNPWSAHVSAASVYLYDLLLIGIPFSLARAMKLVDEISLVGDMTSRSS